MKLLSVRQVADDKIDKDGKKRAYLKNLEIKETNLSLRLNRLKDFVSLEKKQIESEINNFILKSKELITDLEKEISGLESRKIEALKPITKTREQLEQLIKENNKEKQKLKDEWDEISKEQNELTEISITYQDLLEKVNEDNDEIIRQSDNLKEAIKIHRESELKLSTEWKKFYDDVDKFNKNIIKKENAIKAETQANKKIRKEFDEEKKRLLNEQKALQDKYLALKQAHEHLGL